MSNSLKPNGMSLPWAEVPRDSLRQSTAQNKDEIGFTPRYVHHGWAETPTADFLLKLFLLQGGI